YFSGGASRPEPVEGSTADSPSPQTLTRPMIPLAVFPPRLLYNGPEGFKEARVLVTISSRHMDVSASLKAYAEQKSNKLTRYYDRIQEIEVVFDNGKDAM